MLHGQLSACNRTPIFLQLSAQHTGLLPYHSAVPTAGCVKHSSRQKGKKKTHAAQERRQATHGKVLTTHESGLEHKPDNLDVSRSGQSACSIGKACQLLSCNTKAMQATTLRQTVVTQGQTPGLLLQAEAAAMGSYSIDLSVVFLTAFMARLVSSIV